MCTARQLCWKMGIVPVPWVWQREIMAQVTLLKPRKHDASWPSPCGKCSTDLSKCCSHGYPAKTQTTMRRSQVYNQLKDH